MITLSCEIDKEVIPNYEGKWMTLKPIAGYSGYSSVKYSLDFKGNTFIETFLTDVRNYTYNSPGKLATIEGSVAISGNILNFTPHKITFSNYNLETSSASEPYETFTNKDLNFNGVFQGFIMPTCGYQVEYAIVDNQLILTVDYDEDGKYSEGEKMVYTKQ
jgi:hypothetical protein